MKVLIACEESQTVCKAMRERGHEAYSCDIQECSGGHPEWHIKGSVLPVLSGGVEFITMDNKRHKIDGVWDLVIAHPPCTYLTVSGNRWFDEGKYLNNAAARYQDRVDGISFFMKMVGCNAKRLAIENPIGIMSSVYRKPDQIIQPWMFGHGETKATCLWLRNLNPLKPTNIVDGREQRIWRMAPGEDRAKERSRTFQGIAEAMAEQWTEVTKDGEHAMESER